MELGAFTPFLYWMLKRASCIWDILEEETGARLTHSFGRVGGMAKPPTRSFKDDGARERCRRSSHGRSRARSCVLKNRIFLDRVEGVGKHARRGRAIALGWTGPMPALHRRRRTTSARTHPYIGLRPLRVRRSRSAPRGDNYDRFLVRLEEIRQIARIIEQALEQMPEDGPINIDDPRVVLPAKEDVYTTIEAHHRSTSRS